MNSDKKEPNPFLGIQFMNCGTYTRIYRNADKTAYQGMCPSCGVPIKVRIDPGEKGATGFSNTTIPCVLKTHHRIMLKGIYFKSLIALKN